MTRDAGFFDPAGDARVLLLRTPELWETGDAWGADDAEQ